MRGDIQLAKGASKAMWLGVNLKVRVLKSCHIATKT